MNITLQQIMNPGILEVDDKHKKELLNYKEAVQKSNFLDEEQKRQWTLLGYVFTTKQLLEAEKIIIREDLRVMKIKQELERIKPNPKHNA